MRLEAVEVHHLEFRRDREELKDTLERPKNHSVHYESQKGLASMCYSLKQHLDEKS